MLKCFLDQWPLHRLPHNTISTGYVPIYAAGLRRYLGSVWVQLFCTVTKWWKVFGGAETMLPQKRSFWPLPSVNSTSHLTLNYICLCSIFTKAGKHVVKDEWERKYSSKAAVFDVCFSALFYLDGHTICQGLGPYDPWCSYATVAYTTICC